MTTIYSFMILQAPEHLPHPSDNSPISLHSLEDIIIYIILPLLVIILYYIWHKRRSRGEK